MNGPRRSCTLFILVGWFVISCWTFFCCQTGEAAGEATISSSDLDRAAKETMKSYYNAVKAGEESSQEGQGIPSKYWHESIRALSPIKVYIYRLHRVVVQRITDGMEEGIFICNGNAGSGPPRGVGKDGFVLMEYTGQRSVYRFKRMIKTK